MEGIINESSKTHLKEIFSSINYYVFEIWALRVQFLAHMQNLIKFQ